MIGIFFYFSFKRAQDEATKELVGQVNISLFAETSSSLFFYADRFNNIQFQNLQNR
jgi:hypothetical protein